MANSKSGDQNQNLPPIFKHVNGGKGGHKKNMIDSRPVNDMFPSDLEIKNEIVHVHQKSPRATVDSQRQAMDF